MDPALPQHHALGVDQGKDRISRPPGLLSGSKDMDLAPRPLNEKNPVVPRVFDHPHYTRVLPAGEGDVFGPYSQKHLALPPPSGHDPRTLGGHPVSLDLLDFENIYRWTAQLPGHHG